MLDLRQGFVSKLLNIQKKLSNVILCWIWHEMCAKLVNEIIQIISLNLG